MRGRAIRTLRRRHGWTQADLAARIGTDAVTVSRWERGVSHPRLSAQTRLRELSSPGDTVSLAHLVGDQQAARLLRRSLLLARRSARQRFAANPTKRLREVERARREQLDMKQRARFTR